jgi:hypothetical protein
MDKLAVNQGMEDLAVDELRQGMEVGHRPRQDAEDGGSCHQQELAVERMKVARAAGACPAGGGKGVNSLSLSNPSSRKAFIPPMESGVASRVLPSRAKISFTPGITDV